MAVRIPRPRLIERFGSYNNLRSNPYSNSEKILDVRNGVLDPYTQIAQSTLQNSYTVDSLSTFGNTFRARILGVVEGTPAAHVYPELYANSTTTGGIPKYFIFVLRDESDQFAPDPSSYATTVQSYVNTIGLQGRAISEKPVGETVESFGIGDIVEVYKPEQNSWNGAIVRKVVVRNNFSENVVTGSGASFYFNSSGGQPFRSGYGRNVYGGSGPTLPGVTSAEVVDTFKNNRPMKFGVWLDRGVSETMQDLDDFISMWKNNNIAMVNHMITSQTVDNRNPNLDSSQIPTLSSGDKRWPLNFDEAADGFSPAQIAQIADKLAAAGIEYTITVWPYPSRALIDDYAAKIRGFIDAAGPEKIKAIEFDVEGASWNTSAWYGDRSFRALDPPVSFADKVEAAKYLLTKMNEIPSINNGSINLEATTHQGRMGTVGDFVLAAQQAEEETTTSIAKISQWNIQAYSKFEPSEQAARQPGTFQARAAEKFNDQFSSSSPLNPKFGMGLAAYRLSGFDNGALSPYENVLRCVLSTIENSSADRIYFWSVGNLQNQENKNAVYGVTNAYRQVREGDGSFVPEGIDGPEPQNIGTRVTNGPIPGYDRLAYSNGSAIRNLSVQVQLLNILQSVAYQEDLFIEIFSGGQPLEGRRSGSGRHDYGWAADIHIYNAATDSSTGRPSRTGSKIRVTREIANMTSPAQYGSERIYQIALSFFQAGITGMGADWDYMSGDLHVDIANIGNPRSSGPRSAYWGDDGNDNFTTASALEFVKRAWVEAGNAPP